MSEKHLSQTIQIHNGESFKPIIHTIFNQCTHQIQIDFENVNTNLIPEEALKQGEHCRCVQIIHNVQSLRRNKSIVMVTAISRIKKTKINTGISRAMLNLNPFNFLLIQVYIYINLNQFYTHVSGEGNLGYIYIL